MSMSSDVVIPIEEVEKIIKEVNEKHKGVYIENDDTEWIIQITGNWETETYIEYRLDISEKYAMFHFGTSWFIVGFREEEGKHNEIVREILYRIIDNEKAIVFGGLREEIKNWVERWFGDEKK